MRLLIITHVVSLLWDNPQAWWIFFSFFNFFSLLDFSDT